MDATIRTNMDNLHSMDKEVHYKAFLYMLEVTDSPVAWSYEVWDDMVKNLSHKDNHQRAIAAQILCNLARSDPENRMSKDFEALLAVTKDERFVTARHSLQALWKVGLAGKQQEQLVIDDLSKRFDECITEKNCTLIRYDIIQDFKNLYDSLKDEKIKVRALDLIEMEADLKYRKKYASVWKTR